MDSPMPRMSKFVSFDWVDYSVFSGMLLLSSLIGVYFGCCKGGVDTVDLYFHGGKQMSVFPIGMSLIATYISGTTLLGVPTEIYTYGTQYFMSNVANIIVPIITISISLPVFYKLKLISIYEYLERRFDGSVRLTASFLYTLSLLGHIPIDMYGAALALNQVSGLNIHLITPVISSVSLFYTTLGGLKAVAWSDALQGVMMMISVIVVIVIGTIQVGGINAVLDAAYQGERIEFFNMDIDPTTRLTFWSSTIGQSMFWLANFATSPAAIQKCVSLPTYLQAKISVVFLSVGVSAFMSLSTVLGLILYAQYKNCDPLTSGAINQPDQIVPFFVIEVAQKNIKGLSGIFLAGIVSAALSAMSTCLNTLAGTFYQDFIEPTLKKKPSDKTASLIMKLMVILFGIFCILLVAVAEKLGQILEMAVVIGSIAAGTTLGLFLLGMLFPCSNAKGALLGGWLSLFVMGWLSVSSMEMKANGALRSPTKPLSTANCTYLASPTIQTSNQDVFYLYRISIFYYSLIATTIVITSGLFISSITGFNQKEINPDLISPLSRRFLSQKPTKQTGEQTKL